MSTSRTHSWAEKSSETRRFATRKTQTYNDLSVLRADLIRRISTVVSWGEMTPKVPTELSEVVQAYNTSLRNLQSIREEAVALVELLCRRHYVTDDESLDALKRAKSSQTIATEAGKAADYLTLDLICVSVNLEPGLFALPLDEGHLQLQNDLQQSAEDFVDNFLDIMDKLVGLRVVGTIDWPIPTACRFRFFQTKIDVVEEQDVIRTTNKDGKQWRQKYRQTETAHTLHGQQQHLAYARRTELPTYQRTMPIRVRELCDAIPMWLEDRVDVVDGDLFRSDKVEQHLRNETQSELLEETELLYHHDPAIVMGPFVLATWLCEEVDAERHRTKRQSHLHQQDVERQQTIAKQQSYKPLVWAACLQGIPLALQLVAVAYWPALHMAAVVVSLFMLTAFIPQIRRLAIAHSVRPDLSLYLLTAGAGVFAVLGLQVLVLALCYLAFSLLLLGLFLSGVGAFLSRELWAVLQANN